MLLVRLLINSGHVLGELKAICRFLTVRKVVQGSTVLTIHYFKKPLCGWFSLGPNCLAAHLIYVNI